jgi:predicted dehydrogenase
MPEVVRWGVLSPARIGTEKVIPAIQRAERCEVVAIASRDGDRAQEAARSLGVASAYGSYDELLADPGVDAVYVPLPNHLHAEWTIAAARAGKHVLCEKPLALTAADAGSMIEACADAGVLLMEAFMYRLHPSWVAVRELVAQGRIGELRTVQSWFSYFNDDPTNIRNILEVGGGALYDIGCYTVNVPRMLFGAEPIRIQASVERDPIGGTDVLTSGILDFPGGGIGSFTVSTRSEPDQRVHIYGTEGRISIQIPFNIPPHLPTDVFVTAGGDPPVAPATEVLTFPPRDQYTVQAEAFAAAVIDGAPLPTPIEDAVGNLRTIEGIFAAAEDRQAAEPS